MKFRDLLRAADEPNAPLRGFANLSNRKKMDSADIILISDAATHVISLDAGPETLLKPPEHS